MSTKFEANPGPRRIATVVILAIGMVLFAGCAKVPTDEIRAADDAIASAKAAVAEEYAPEALQKAADARARLDAELKTQEERFAPLRSYETSTALAKEVAQAAAEAESSAVEARSRARDEAANLIAQVRVTLEEVKTMLETAPRGKGSELDLAMLGSDVSGIEGSLAETEQAFSSERYRESKAMAQAALDSTAQIRGQIERATAERATARRPVRS